ncbi:MAG: cobalamin-dependent protein, partial [Chromatiales bacterium]|nr:cobalamin-dependent protein [Chromatiales bacterium]
MELLLLRVPSTGAAAKCVDPPISQGLIAAAAQARGIRCEVLDLSFHGDDGIDLLLDAMNHRDLRVVGVSAYQTNIERCMQIARLVKGVRGDVKVILGGPQATHMPAIGLEAMPMVDGLCRGAGEHAMPQLLEALRAGCETVPGFLLRTTDGLIEVGVPVMLPQVDSLPSPFRIPLWPLDRYPLGVLFSNRGCPHNCAFCYTPAASGRRLSQRVKEGVLKDIVAMAKANVEHVFFADPVFLPSAHRPLQLLEDL